MKRKQRAFIIKFQNVYSSFNHGKSGKQAKRNRRIGERQIRAKFKKELQQELNLRVE